MVTRQINEFSENLYDPEVFRETKALLFDIHDVGDPFELVGMARGLAKALRRVQPANEAEREMREVLYTWYLKLKLGAFFNLSDGEKSELFSLEALNCYKLNLDIKDTLRGYFSLFVSAEQVTNMARSFLNSLQANTALLGQSNDFEQYNFQPTINSWIKEYLAYRVKQNNLPPDNFAVSGFMNTHNLVRKLSVVNKSALQNILQLVNFLLTAKPREYSERNLTSPDGSSGQIQQNNLKTEEDFSNLPSPDIISTPEALNINLSEPPQVSGNNKMEKMIDSGDSVSVSPSSPRVMPVPKKPVAIMPPPAVLGSRSQNIQNLLQKQPKNGQSPFGIQNIPKNRESLEPAPINKTVSASAPVAPNDNPEPEQPKVNIDEKLEDLKHRASIKN